jgi:hypothetical protein
MPNARLILPTEDSRPEYNTADVKAARKAFAAHCKRFNIVPTIRQARKFLRETLSS